MAAQALPRGRIFLLLVVIESVACLVFQSLHIAAHIRRNDPPANALYSGLIIIGIIFFDYFAFDGVLNKNIIQVLSFLAISVLFTIYVVIQYLDDALTRELLLAQLIIVAFCQVLLPVLGYWTNNEVGWQVFERIGADPRMKSMYQTYQIFVAVMKADFQMQVILLIMNLVLVLQPSDYEFYVDLVLVLPLMLTVVFTGIYAIWREHVRLLILFFVSASIVPVYIIFRVYRLYDVPRYRTLGIPFNQVVVSAIVGLFVRISLVIMAVAAYMNFNKGLKDFFVNGKAPPVQARRLSIRSTSDLFTPPSTSGTSNPMLSPSSMERSFDGSPTTASPTVNPVMDVAGQPHVSASSSSTSDSEGPPRVDL